MIILPFALIFGVFLIFGEPDLCVVSCKRQSSFYWIDLKVLVCMETDVHLLNIEVNKGNWINNPQQEP